MNVFVVCNCLFLVIFRQKFSVAVANVAKVSAWKSDQTSVKEIPWQNEPSNMILSYFLFFNRLSINLQLPGSTGWLMLWPSTEKHSVLSNIINKYVHTFFSLDYTCSVQLPPTEVFAFFPTGLWQLSQRKVHFQHRVKLSPALPDTQVSTEFLLWGFCPSACAGDGENSIILSCPLEGMYFDRNNNVDSPCNITSSIMA